MQDNNIRNVNRPVRPQVPVSRPAQAARPMPPAETERPTKYEKPHKKKRSKGKFIGIVLAVLIIAGLAGVVIFQQMKINSGTSEQEAAKNVQEKVAKIMILPEEDALVSDISDVSKISGQPFFAKAENGDKVLIFVQAAKIVIYRESTNQIVNAGPLVDDREATTDTSAE